MKTITKKLIIIFCLVLVSISYVGCGSSDDITGTWIKTENENSDEGMRFYDDGTCLDVCENSTGADATNWKIQEDGMLILEFEWDGNASYERVENKEDALEDRDLYYLSGDTLVFRKSEYKRK